MSPTVKLSTLQAQLASLPSAIIAYSGGVDSTFLARVAHDVLGDRAVALTAASESLAQGELEEARALAQQIGIRHVVLHTHETENEDYLANPTNRCYYCKTELYTEVRKFAATEGIEAILDGLNHDDLRDRRPGRAAAQQHGVRSPLMEAGLTKAEIRELSRELGLPTWDKPALACLSSRIPYGTRITLQALSQVDRAEMYLRSLGLHQVRVRHYSDTARIEVEPHQFSLLLDRHREVVAYLNALGFTFVTLDLAGYRTGSMNPKS